MERTWTLESYRLVFQESLNLTSHQPSQRETRCTQLVKHKSEPRERGAEPWGEGKDVKTNKQIKNQEDCLM